MVKKRLTLLILFILITSAVCATEMGEEIRGTIENIDPEEPGALKDIIDETMVIGPFLDEGLITQEEADEFNKKLADLSKQWLDNTLNGLDPGNYSFLPYVEVQWILELVEGSPEDFGEWGWDEGVIDGAHGRIQDSASKWLKNRVDELDPSNPDFTPWNDMLILQQVPELWDVKFDEESKAYKMENFYDKYDQWLINMANRIATLGDLENMTLLQDALYNDEYYNKFSDDAKWEKAGIMEEKFATLYSKAVNEGGADLKALGDQCKRILFDKDIKILDEFKYFEPVCDSTYEGSLEDMNKALNPRKESVWKRMFTAIKRVFSKPKPIGEIEVSEKPIGTFLTPVFEIALTEEGKPVLGVGPDASADTEGNKGPIFTSPHNYNKNPNFDPKTCGNGQMDTGEQCDPGMTPDGCSPLSAFKCLEHECICELSTLVNKRAIDTLAIGDPGLTIPGFEDGSLLDGPEIQEQCNAEDDAYSNQASCESACKEGGDAFKCMKNYKTNCWDCVYQDPPHITFPDGKTDCGLDVKCPPPKPGCKLIGWTYVKNHMVMDHWGEGKPDNNNGYVFIRSRTTSDCDEIISCVYGCDTATCSAADSSECGAGNSCDTRCNEATPLCGDGAVDSQTEECDPEAVDNGCFSGEYCDLDCRCRKQVTTQAPYCGDGSCDKGIGERCDRCDDCDCDDGFLCDPSDNDANSRGCAPVTTTTPACGDGSCDGGHGERCDSCDDCDCDTGWLCDPSAHDADDRGCLHVEPITPVCGDGSCDRAHGERCDTCGDCACSGDRVCYPEGPLAEEDGCYPITCGDGECMIEGEDCGCSDCECPIGLSCDPGAHDADPMGCSVSGGGAVCGNGMCEETEYCYSCASDCSCGEGQFCAEENLGIGCAPLP